MWAEYRFYEFAGFGGNVDVFTMIRTLTTAASSVDDEKIKEEILGQITALAINGIVKSKRNSGETRITLSIRRVHIS